MRIPVSCRSISLLVLLALCGCDNPAARPAAPIASNPPAAAGVPAPPTVTSATRVADPATAPVAASPEPAPPIEGPTPPPDAGRACATDADCAIKDAGSCCGMRPVCLHKDTPTFPEQVKAKCAKEGRVSACGFLAITGCQCVAGKCEGVLQSDNGLQVQ